MQADITSHLQQLLSPEIKSLKELIKEQLQSEVPLASEIAQHAAGSGGKMLRPAMLLLFSKMFGYGDPLQANIKLACAVEFIHSATLIHDDVVDSSEMRRNKPAAHVIWGNKASILVGDFLFSQSFRMMVAAQSLQAMESLSTAAKVISEGEVRQLEVLDKGFATSEDEYMEIINSKTGALFGAATHIGAIICDMPAAVQKSAKMYGLLLGNIFQITDDMLDYLGDEKLLGKNTGDDFFEGKITLPLIVLAGLASESQRAIIQELFAKKEKTKEDLSIVQELMREHKIEHYISEHYIKKLNINCLKIVDDLSSTIKSKYTEILRLLADYAGRRTM